MNNDEMQSMMQEMLTKLSSDQKMEMMMGMVGKLKEGINMQEMVSKNECKGKLGPHEGDDGQDDVRR